MEGPVYLDSSAIVKRYVKEPGSQAVRALYLKAYAGDVELAFSLWNVGEVLGALARAARLGRLSSTRYAVARARFIAETRRLLRLRAAVAVPVRSRVLRESWRLVESRGLYEADALQLASAKYVGARRLVTGDRLLHDVAVEEGLEGVYVG
ncbi:MAG: PIN domain nuclease [Thermoprotei archaeon]|nr:MAG: PIN domain nuclease [Thermoprotei archaeon]